MNIHCQDPKHDERNRGLWHRWHDDKGRMQAARCPESINAEKIDREAMRETKKKADTSWID